MSGIAYGVGVGPGDPELMTQKVIRLIRENDVIAVPGQDAKASVAYGIAASMVPELAQKELVPVPMPMTRDKERLRKAHVEGARLIESYLNRGKNVVYLTLGDPSIYGSFSYLQRLLLADGYPVETVPGVPSFSAATARLNLPLVEGDEPLHVAPGAHDMGETLRLPGTCVLMKAAGPLGETKARLKSSGKEVFAVENCGMDTERLYRGVDQLPDSAGYLSLIVAKDPPDRP